MSFQYKPGQVPFEKADRSKSFNELLGVVPEHISFPHFSEGKSKIENKVISRIRRCYLKDDKVYQRNIKLNFTYSSLGNITLNTCFEISYFGLESVQRFYEMYAEHAEPTTKSFNLETSKTGELSGSFDQVNAESEFKYIDKCLVDLILLIEKYGLEKTMVALTVIAVNGKFSKSHSKNNDQS
jgi:hypothetical protein